AIATTGQERVRLARRKPVTAIGVVPAAQEEDEALIPFEGDWAGEPPAAGAGRHGNLARGINAKLRLEVFQPDFHLANFDLRRRNRLLAAHHRDARHD